MAQTPFEKDVQVQLEEYLTRPAGELAPKLFKIENGLPAISLLAEINPIGEAASALPILQVRAEALRRVLDLKKEKYSGSNEPWDFDLL